MATLVEEAHRQAMRQDIGTIARSLQETLGQSLTAFAAGIKDPKAVGKYALGRKPRHDAERRLREVYQVVQLLLEAETPATARAWMIGRNPQLGDEAPIEILHGDELAPVLRSAEAFRAG